MTSINSVVVPSAPAFLDPLIEIDTCYYYSVPKFFGFQHPNTRWLIAMVKAKEEDRVKRKMEMNPEMFKGKYFQMMDYPRLYLPDDPSVTPMFKRQSVLYLTALGMSIYLRSLPLIDLILFHKDPYEELVGNPNEPQFASHLQDLKYGDFHAFPPCVIMLRMYCFESTVSLLQAGWNPTQPLALPMRRKFERRAFYFFDWLELALGLLSERPLYPLQSLILNMTRNMTLYRHLMLPLTHLLPKTPKQQIHTGLIDVEELPVGTRMIGVRSLLEMAEDYDRYLQMRSCAVEVAALKREAVAVGLNPEILMIQAQDFDGFVADKAAEAEGNDNNACNSNHWRGTYLGRGKSAARHWSIEHDTRIAVNANNSATDAAAAATSAPPSSSLNKNASAKKKAPKAIKEYASEACRVMHYAMEKDKASNRMQVCLDSIIVMTKRGFFVNGERLAPEVPRARDLRNVIVLLLNMIQREQEKLDVIFVKIQSGYKKFQHLEEHKLLENRRLASVFNISKMVSALTRILLHSKELVAFISVDFPPFPPSTVDFKLKDKLVMKFNDIKINVVQEFNSIKDGWTYLTKEMLLEVASIKSMQLHFRLGTKPTAQAILDSKKAARKSAMRGKSKNNMSNTNCLVTFRKVQRIQRKSHGCYLPTDVIRDRDLPAVDSLLPSGSSNVESFDEASDANAVFDPEDNSLPHPQQQQQRQQQQQQQQQQRQQQQQPVQQEQNQQQEKQRDPLLQQLDGWGGSGDKLKERLPSSALDDEEMSGNLSETEVLMSSLYREVQDLLRPPKSQRSIVEASGTSLIISAGTSTQFLPLSSEKDDVATIEPEPGCCDGSGSCSAVNTSCCQPSPGNTQPGSRSSQLSRYYQPGHRHSQPFCRLFNN